MRLTEEGGCSSNAAAAYSKKLRRRKLPGHAPSPRNTERGDVAYLPLDQVQPHLASGRLTRALAKFTPDLPGYHLYYPHRRHASTAFTAFLEAVRFRG